MKLIILGKYGPYAPVAGATSGYLLENNGEYVLIDMGSGVLSRVQEYIDPTLLKCVFISHIHNDHMNDLYLFKYMLDILYNKGELKNKIKLVGPAELSELVPSPMFEYIPFTEQTCLHEAGMNISFAQMKHPVPSMAMRFKGNADFVYSGDCNDMEKLTDFATGCEYLLCDVGTPPEMWKPSSPHLNFRLAAQAAQTVGATLILTHIMPGIDQEHMLKEISGICKAVCAEEYAQYEL